jgi:hypothetical protein
MNEAFWVIVITFLVFIALRCAVRAMISMVTGEDDEEEKGN